MDDECRTEAIHQADELAFPMRLEAELAAATAPLHQTIAERDHTIASLQKQAKELEECVEELQSAASGTTKSSSGSNDS